MSESNNTATPSPRRRRQIFWRRIQALAGLALALAFFMPAVDGCNQPEYPCSNAAQLLTPFVNSSPIVEQLGELMMGFAVFCSAYLFGLLTLLYATRRANLRVDREFSSDALPLNLLAGITFLPFVVWPVWAFANGIWPGSGVDVPDIIFISIATASTIYWILTTRGGAKGTFCLRWYFSLLCTAWFTWWIVIGLIGGGLYYGMWTSFFASLIIFIALTAEARIHTRTGTWPTLGCLIICRFRAFKSDDSQCENCGYLLTGLTVPRCPECGQSFTWPDQPTRLPPTE